MPIPTQEMSSLIKFIYLSYNKLKNRTNALSNTEDNNTTCNNSTVSVKKTHRNFKKKINNRLTPSSNQITTSQLESHLSTSQRETIRPIQISIESNKLLNGKNIIDRFQCQITAFYETSERCLQFIDNRFRCSFHWLEIFLERVHSLATFSGTRCANIHLQNNLWTLVDSIIKSIPIMN